MHQVPKLAKHQGHTDDTFEYYQKSIKNILKDKNVIAKIPAIMLLDFPQDLLCGVWHNFCYERYFFISTQPCIPSRTSSPHSIAVHTPIPEHSYIPIIHSLGQPSIA